MEMWNRNGFRGLWYDFLAGLGLQSVFRYPFFTLEVNEIVLNEPIQIKNLCGRRCSFSS